MKKLFKKLKGPKVGGGKPKELDDPPDPTPKYVVDPYSPVHDPAANYGPKSPSPPPVKDANDQGDLTGFPGYDAWLGSFTTDPQNLGFSELQGGPAANEVIRIEGTNRDPGGSGLHGPCVAFSILLIFCSVPRLPRARVPICNFSECEKAESEPRIHRHRRRAMVHDFGSAESSYATTWWVPYFQVMIFPEACMRIPSDKSP